MLNTTGLGWIPFGNTCSENGQDHGNGHGTFTLFVVLADAFVLIYTNTF